MFVVPRWSAARCCLAFLYAAAANAFAIVLPALDDDTDLLAWLPRLSARLVCVRQPGARAGVVVPLLPARLVGLLPLAAARSCATSTLAVVICRAIFEMRLGRKNKGRLTAQGKAPTPARLGPVLFT